MARDHEHRNTSLGIADLLGGDIIICALKRIHIATRVADRLVLCELVDSALGPGCATVTRVARGGRRRVDFPTVAISRDALASARARRQGQRKGHTHVQKLRK